MQEKVTHTQTLYDGRIVRLDLVDVTLPDGKPARRELVRHPGAVAIVAVDGDDVLLVRQYRLAADRIMLEIPAGTLRPEEAPLDCADRELQEETGYRPGKLEPLGGIFVAPGYTTEFIHLFLATQLSESRLPLDDDEFVEVERVSIKAALRQIDQGAIIDGKTVSGLLMAARRLGL
jgi:ADP-ribose pyrophosphatase